MAKNNMQGRTATIVLSIIGLIAAAGVALVVTVLQRSAVFSSAPAQILALDARPINKYITEALKIHSAYKVGKATREETKKRALALQVPTVLKDRHVQWVLALDAKTEEVINELMSDYALVSVTK